MALQNLLNIFNFQKIWVEHNVCFISPKNGLLFANLSLNRGQARPEPRKSFSVCARACGCVCAFLVILRMFIRLWFAASWGFANISVGIWFGDLSQILYRRLNCLCIVFADFSESSSIQWGYWESYRVYMFLIASLIVRMPWFSIWAICLYWSWDATNTFIFERNPVFEFLSNYMVLCRLKVLLCSQK